MRALPPWPVNEMRFVHSRAGECNSRPRDSSEVTLPSRSQDQHVPVGRSDLALAPVALVIGDPRRPEPSTRVCLEGLDKSLDGRAAGRDELPGRLAGLAGLDPDLWDELKFESVA